MSECKYEFRQPVGVCYGGQWFQGVAIKPTDYDGFTWCRFWNGEEAYFSEVRFPLDRIRPDPDFALVRLHDEPEPPQPIGTLDACRDRVELLNQGLDLVIAVLNNGDAPPALRDAAVLAVQAAKLKLGGES